MITLRPFLALATLVLSAMPILAAEVLPAVCRSFPPSAVRLLDGPFKKAQDLDLAYILALDPDRLLAPFRREAGLTMKAKPYGNWESGGLDGHIGGHYLSALAWMHAATGDAECRRRLDHMVAELAECQAANGDGYVGGIPGSKAFWAAFVTEERPGRLIGKKWVPWYNLHKTYAGLRDAWQVCGSQQARDVLLKLCDWALRITAHLTPAQWEDMLGIEFGGMNDILAEVGALAGRPDLIALGDRFSHRWLLDSLAERRDALTGKHANTQIPKVVGYERMAQVAGSRKHGEAARFFWETVVQRRSVAIGGNSVGEHFHALDDFTRLIEHREGPESCNTYNMIKLTELLHARTGEARYADFIERALFNHILSTQHPTTGGFVYFTPMRPEHYRVYSQPQECMWCCVGTGLENHGRYGSQIYTHAGVQVLHVNQFIASTLTWADARITVRQATAFPDEERTRLTFAMPAPTAFALHLRHPAWVAEGAFTVTVNGQVQTVASRPSSYAVITRTWHDGDTVEVHLPMRTVVEPLPAKPDYVAVLRGPVVLAAATGTDGLKGLHADGSRMGHVAHGPLVPIERTPVLVGGLDAIAAAVKPVTGGAPLTFSAAEAILPESRRTLILQPFFRLHDSRYVIYWRHAADAAAFEAINTGLRAAEAAALALDRATLDRVAPGEQQSETEHNLRGEGHGSGFFNDRHWRHATGWFGYDLKAPVGKPVTLFLTTWGGDRRTFDVSVNGTLIATITTTGDGQRFVDHRYPLPEEVVAKAAGVYAVTFTARAGSHAGGIFDLRLVEAKP